jgi:hypothetical protein
MRLPSHGFNIRVCLLPGSCLTRLMRLPPHGFKIRVYLLLGSYLTRLKRLPPLSTEMKNKMKNNHKK